MNSFIEISNAIKAAKKISIYPHMHMDGDALGSCVALSHALDALGKESKIILAEEIPDNLKFLDYGTCTWDLEDANDSDISILVDCDEIKRIKGREEAFKKGKMSICIDHHETSKPICDLNIVKPQCAATGQMIYSLITELEVKGTPQMADAIFTAITTDTGNFQYSNTEKKSHEIVSQLYDWGLNASKVSLEVYENKRLERLKIEADALARIKIFGGGKAALTYVSQAMLKETGALMEETESIVNAVRSIKGVEIAVLLKEEEENVIRASLRSKEWLDVSELATFLGGGGHKRASGYTAYMSLEEAEKKVTEAIEERLNK